MKQLSPVVICVIGFAVLVVVPKPAVLNLILGAALLTYAIITIRRSSKEKP